MAKAPARPAPKPSRAPARGAATTASRRPAPEEPARTTRVTGGPSAGDPRSNEPARSPSRGAVAVRAGEALPAELGDLMEEDAGKGLSSDQADNLVPLIYVLQPLSPQVNSRGDAYIEGAEPGHIWLRNSEDPLHNEFWFQPCHFSKDWVEWIPRKSGGGFVARYDYDKKPSDAEQYQDPERPQSIRWKRKNGNDLVETRYFAGYVIFEDGRPALPYIIPLSSTGHSFGKTLMFRMNGRQTPAGSRAPSYSTMYLIDTVQKSNNAGEWYQFNLTDNHKWVTDKDQYLAGRALQQAFESGAKMAEAPDDPNAAPGDGYAGDENRPM